MTYLPISYLKGNLEYPNSAIVIVILLKIIKNQKKKKNDAKK